MRRRRDRFRAAPQKRTSRTARGSRGSRVARRTDAAAAAAAKKECAEGVSAKNKFCSLTGNRTPAACVTGRNTDHYTIKDEKSLVSAGIRTRNLLLRRQAPYPLGHRDRTADRGPKKVPLRPREGSNCCLDRIQFRGAQEPVAGAIRFFFFKVVAQLGPEASPAPELGRDASQPRLCATNFPT